MTDKAGEKLEEQIGIMKWEEYNKGTHKIDEAVMSRLAAELAAERAKYVDAASEYSKLFSSWMDEQAQVRRLEDQVKVLRDALGGITAAAIGEVNEKGAGGYFLARLHDAREALHATEPKGEKAL